MSTGDPPVPNLDVVGDLEIAAWKIAALQGALDLDVFTLMSSGPRSFESIVAETGWDRRGTRTLLDALCPLGLLAKERGTYVLTDVSSAYFVRGKPSFYGDFCRLAELSLAVKARTAEAVRTGAAVGRQSLMDVTGEAAAELWADNGSTALVDWPLRAADAREMWARAGVSRATCPGARVLDVACGCGVKGFVVAQDDAESHVTGIDFPAVVRLAQRVAEAMGVEERVALRAADTQETDFGRDEFDIVLCGNHLYFFSGAPLMNLLCKAHGALVEGGRLVINEGIADDERCREEIALTVALQLLLFIPGSEVRTFSEYGGLLEKAGFSDITAHGPNLLSARKAG